MQNRTIMTIDDSASIRQMVSFTLKNAGFDVLAASNGVEALSSLDGRPIDLMLVDLNMPKMDGISLIRKIRSDDNYRYIPLVMLTTESQSQKKQEGKQAGATGWIVKPFHPDQLISVVYKVLGCSAAA